MKYKELDSIQRANYWSLMMILEITDIELGENHPLTDHIWNSVRVLSRNLKLELYTDGEDCDCLDKSNE